MKSFVFTDDKVLQITKFRKRDSVFKATTKVVPNYKTPTSNIPQKMDYEIFHNSLRISSEHAVGRVKENFQVLRQLPVNIHDK